jgi:hypothetical protein
MKKLILLSLVCMGIAYNAHAITKTQWENNLSKAVITTIEALNPTKLFNAGDLEDVNRITLPSLVKQWNARKAEILAAGAGGGGTPPAPTSGTVVNWDQTIKPPADEVVKLLKEVQSELKKIKDEAGPNGPNATTLAGAIETAGKQQ